MGIIVLFAGVVLLLQNLGFLPWGFWMSLWRFWPVLIIIMGLNILLQRFNPWLVGVTVLIVLVATVGAATCQQRLF
ncbi:MAG: DUF5668 domain-containing protein [Chloroflexota bacterium]